MLKRIEIGSNVTLASRVVVHGGARVHDDVIIGPFSMVPEDFEVAAGQEWNGSPVQRVKAPPVNTGAWLQHQRIAEQSRAEPPGCGKALVLVLCQILLLLLLAGINIACFLPSIVVVTRFMDAWPGSLEENAVCLDDYFCSGDLYCTQVPMAQQPSSEGSSWTIVNSEDRYCIAQEGANDLQARLESVEAEISTNVCTVGGVQLCEFPFEYAGTKHTGCIFVAPPSGVSVENGTDGASVMDGSRRQQGRQQGAAGAGGGGGRGAAGAGKSSAGGKGKGETVAGWCPIDPGSHADSGTFASIGYCDPPCSTSRDQFARARPPRMARFKYYPGLQWYQIWSSMVFGYVSYPILLWTCCALLIRLLRCIVHSIAMSKNNYI